MHRQRPVKKQGNNVANSLKKSSTKVEAFMAIAKFMQNFVGVCIHPFAPPLLAKIV